MLPTRIEFLHEWGTHRRGDVVGTINPSDAEVLVLNRIARPAGGLAVTPATATTTVVTTPPATAKLPRASAKKRRES